MKIKLVLMLGLIVYCTSPLAQPRLLQQKANIPPTLAQWYKPENSRQVWLHTMFGLRRELQAVREYSEQRDHALMQKWAKKFLKHYRSLPQMVPQWRDEVDLQTAARLQMAVEQGKDQQVIRISKQLTKSCRSCHRQYQLLVRLRYRSADFSKIRIDHDGQSLRYSRFKTELIRSLNRVKIAISDQHWSRASAALVDVRQRLNSFKKTCDACHQDKQPMARILGRASEQNLSRLQQSIEQQDVKLGGRMLGTVAVNICARCHGIHRDLSEIRSALFPDN